MLLSPASVGTALRLCSRCVASSVKSVGRAHTLRALRWPASEAAFVYCSFPTPDPLLRRRPAEGFWGALGFSRFGFRRHRPGSSVTGIPRHLTIRSSRPHVVASAMCLCATLAHVRRPATGRLNSGVRCHEETRSSNRMASWHYRAVFFRLCFRCARCCQYLCITSVSTLGALNLRMRHVRPLRKKLIDFR